MVFDCAKVKRLFYLTLAGLRNSSSKSLEVELDLCIHIMWQVISDNLLLNSLYHETRTYGTSSKVIQYFHIMFTIKFSMQSL